MFNVKCLKFDFYLRTSLLLLLHMGITARRRRSRRRSLRDFFKRGGWWKLSWGEVLRKGRGETLIPALLIVSSSTHCHLSLKIVTTTIRGETINASEMLVAPWMFHPLSSTFIHFTTESLLTSTDSLLTFTDPLLTSTIYTLSTDFYYLSYDFY